jgi:hypothetical protein
MADELRRLAIEARKRAVAGILQHVETKLTLTTTERQDLRDKVMTSIGAYHDLVLDMIKVQDGPYALNEETLRVLQLVHASQQRLEQGARSG